MPAQTAGVVTAEPACLDLEARDAPLAGEIRQDAAVLARGVAAAKWAGRRGSGRRGPDGDAIGLVQDVENGEVCGKQRKEGVGQLVRLELQKGRTYMVITRRIPQVAPEVWMILIARLGTACPPSAMHVRPAGSRRAARTFRFRDRRQGAGGHLAAARPLRRAAAGRGSDSMSDTSLTVDAARLLAELEFADRAPRRCLQRHLLESHLPSGKTLDSFHLAAVPMLSRAHVIALASDHSWREKGSRILLFGPSGSGKAHLGRIPAPLSLTRPSVAEVSAPTEGGSSA